VWPLPAVCILRLCEVPSWASAAYMLRIARLSLPPLPYARVSGFLAGERTFSSERCLGSVVDPSKGVWRDLSLKVAGSPARTGDALAATTVFAILV
jgi:hypothetical protein